MPTSLDRGDHDHPLQGMTLCALIGPTAAGKSRTALAVAERCGADIVSLDSMLVYRGMDIGTAKPTSAEQARVRHHMLDRVDPHACYDVQRYFAELRTVIRALAREGRRALFVGGTGFYLKALTSGLFAGPPVDRELRARIESRLLQQGNVRAHEELARVDPRAAARIHVQDTKRLVRALEVFEQTGRPISEWQSQWEPSAGGAVRAPRVERRLVGLELANSELDRRIAARTGAMLAAGWIEEALAIRAARGFSPTSIQALGYREVLELADQRIDAHTCRARIVQKTRRFARRQRTWYRKFEDVRWFESPGESADPVREGELADAIATALEW